MFFFFVSKDGAFFSIYIKTKDQIHCISGLNLPRRETRSVGHLSLLYAFQKQKFASLSILAMCIEHQKQPIKLLISIKNLEKEN